MKAWASLALAVLLASCAEAPSYPTAPTASEPQGQAAPQAPPRTPAPARPLASPVPRTPSYSAAGGRDACGAAQMQGLIGRPRSMIPVPVDPSRQRVACTTCPAAADADPSRLNFLFDADTGVIRQVRCG